MAPLCKNEFEENDIVVLCTDTDVTEGKIQDGEEEILIISALEGNNVKAESITTGIITTMLTFSTPSSTRGVSFSDEAIVHTGAVINIDDYTDEEKNVSWYNIDEMRSIREEVKQTVACMNRMIPKDEIESDSLFCSTQLLCTRGLEGKTRGAKRHRRSCRMKSIAAVFDEQSMQDMDGIADTYMIALAYNEYAYPMQVAAFERAAQYQKEEREATITDTKINDDVGDDNDRTTLASTTNNTIVGSSSNNDDDKLSHVTGPPTKDNFHNDNSHSVHLDKENQFQLLEIEKIQDAEIAENNETTNNDYTVSFQHHNGIDIIPTNEEHFISMYSEIIMQDLNNNNNRNDVGGGPTRFRDRFTCLLSTSTSSQSLKSNVRRSFLGALRVVHI